MVTATSADGVAVRTHHVGSQRGGRLFARGHARAAPPRLALRDAIEQCGGDMERAAHALDVSRMSFWRMRKRAG